MTTLGDIALLVRAPAALSVPGDVLAGAAATDTLGARAVARAAALAAGAVCLYWAGMAANDWADRDLDARERPERPIPSGRVTPRTALGVGAALSAAGLTLQGLAGGRRALTVAVPLVSAVWCYDLKLKATTAGPAAMAACRALDVLAGARAGTWRHAVTPALTVAAHTYTVTVLSRREVTGGSRLLPGATLAGTAAVAAVAAARRTRAPRASGASGASGAPGASGASGAPGALGRRHPRRGLLTAGLTAGLAAWYARDYGSAQVRALLQPDACHLRAAVEAGVTGLPVLQGALIAGSGAPATGAAVAVAAPVGRVLARRVSPT